MQDAENQAFGDYREFAEHPPSESWKEVEAGAGGLKSGAVRAVWYPVAIDSDHSIWNSFRNAYWPADYFIDREGRIRYRHFGEGEYDRAERVIQTLLRENGVTDLDEHLVHISVGGPEAPPKR